MKNFGLLIFILLSIGGYAQQKRIYRTNRVSSEINIDGVLNENEWGSDNWQGDFTQREPNDGAAPSQPTSFKVLYSDDYIFVAIKAFDNRVDSIDSRLVRSDDIDGDVVGVHFDSYHDKNTSFSFFVNAAGVKSDIFFSNNGNNEDENWNPIWYAKTSKDSKGWYAEIKIPLSQLRFSNSEHKIWGFELMRTIYRLDETSLWQPISLKESGWVFNYGELVGIDALKPKRIMELAPYVSTSMETYEKGDGPYQSGRDFNFNAGVDAKIGITNDFVMDITVNPDFGQVESDPSEVNLTAFETYQREQRPFFVAGKNITDYRISEGEGDSGRDNLFYSRRIGKYPSYYPTADYVDFPRNTKILGALKLSGKTKGGLSVGIIESVTRREYAHITSNGVEQSKTVEPLTNYSILRVQKDFNKGSTIIGGEVTSVNRQIEDDELLFLPKNAISGGLDFQKYWKKRTFYFKAKIVGSNISGSKASMLERQLAPQRYFQRPDASYINVDSNRTNLSGYGGDIRVGKQNESGWSYGLRFLARSPSLSLNDVGYLRQADKLMQAGNIEYNFTKPTRIYRHISTGITAWNGWDYGGNTIFSGAYLWHRTKLKDNSTISIHSMNEFNRHDNFMLRGGPTFFMPAYTSIRFNYETNDTKKFYFDIGTRQSWATYSSSRLSSFDAGFTYRPIDALSLAFHPNFSTSKRSFQYVDQFPVNNSTDYLLATINQKTLVFRFMIDYNISPTFTIQYYGSPFISTGEYSEFKRVADGNSSNYNDRFHEFNSSEITQDADGNYSVDANGDGNADYSFDNPNFNFKEFQSNLVLRWEFTPGSMLFIVWTQNRVQEEGVGTFTFSDDMKNLFDTYPQDIIMIKLSYRIFR